MRISTVLSLALVLAGTPCFAQTTDLPDAPRVIQDSVHSSDGFNSNGRYSIPSRIYPVQLVPHRRDPTAADVQRFIDDTNECAQQGLQISSLPGEGRRLAHCVNLKMGLKEKNPDVPFLAEAVITAESR